MTASVLDRGLLLGYRLRPLEPLMLLGTLSAAVAAGVWMIPAAPPPPPEVLVPANVTVPLAVVALALSLAAGFVAGRDADAAERLLFSAPTPHRRAIALRGLLWGGVSAAIVWMLGGRAEAALGGGSGGVTRQALVYLLFGIALVVALGRVAGPFVGGGIALTLVLSLAGAPSYVEGFPLHVLALAESPQWRATEPRLIGASALVLVVTFWSLGRTARS